MGIGNIFAVASRWREIREDIALYNSIKPQITRLIASLESIAKDAGMLDATQSGGVSLPSGLAKYDFGWVQRTLNEVYDAGLHIDGQLGPEGSNTRKAVKAAQHDYNMKKPPEAHPLEEDGIPGLQTIAVLELALAQARSQQPAASPHGH